MTFGRLTIALAALAGALAFGSFTTAGTAEAHGWRHHHRPHYGYSYGYRYEPSCWTEWRKVRVHTRYGWRWRDRRVTLCR